MPKTKISEYSSTASNNTDISGINIAEGCAPSGINDAIRTVMAQLKDWQSGAVAQDNNFNGAVTVSGAAVLSSTLAVSGAATLSGATSLEGNATIGNASTDAHVLNGSLTCTTSSVIYLDDSVTTASAPVLSWDSDSNTGFFRPAADTIGVSTGGSERMRVDANGKVLIGPTTARSDFFSSTGSSFIQIEGTSSDPASLSITRNSNDTSSPLFVLAKTRGTAVGGATIVQSGDVCGIVSFQGFDGTDFAELARINAIVDGTPGANDMPGALTFRTTADGAATTTERMRINSNGTLLVGRTVDTTGTDGIALFANGTGYFERDAGTVVYVNRLTNDGTLVTFAQATTTEGSISVSGTTVSYNAFAGSHWSQLQDGSKPNILRGTVMESIDELVVWPNEPNTERLCKVKVSDTAGSKKVYGVFMDWDNDWEATNDLYVTSLGAFVCRVNSGVMVQVGDLLESNGDGTARVQADDIIRSSTIGKVTCTTKTHQYDDGSYCVPTVLYCG